MLTVSGLYIYPIKSLGGISLSSAMLTDRGLEQDRRWMLVDIDNRFLTQREHPAMALLQVSLDMEGGIKVHHKLRNEPPLHIPIPQPGAPTVSVTVWDDSCSALHVSAQVDEWFSRMLDIPCRLVYMPDDARREVDPQYAHNREITSFSDAFPILIIGQASLDDLNARLTQPLPMDRFRPNIVFTGGNAYQEDEMSVFGIAGIRFFGVKPCARCVMTVIDQRTGTRGKEPLRTLSTYRQRNNKIYFGQNLLFQGHGRIALGDAISLDTINQD